jgi:hypothetical protein
VDSEGDPIIDPSTGKPYGIKDLLKGLGRTGGGKSGRTFEQTVGLMEKGQALSDQFHKAGMPWDKALKRLMQLQIPKGQAIELLRNVYERGEADSPWFSDKEMVAARKAMGQPKLKWVIGRLNELLAADKGPPTEDEVRTIKLIIDDVLHHGGRGIMWRGRGRKLTAQDVLEQSTSGSWADRITPDVGWLMRFGS